MSLAVRDVAPRPGPYAADPTALYARMLLIRRFEERLSLLFSENRLPGDVHLSIGQEAVAVGFCALLEASDFVAGSHRAHGLAIAKGVPLAPLLAELLGRGAGLCGGKGGSMHIAHRESGFLGAFPVVGAAPPLAAGAALTAKRERSGAVSAVFLGDGALNQGLTMETMNLAAVWRLPLIFVLENNGWAETTRVSDAFAIQPLARRADGFGIPARTIDGQDLEQVLSAAEWALGLVRLDKGPAFVECLTERFRGHYEGDPGGYRSAEEEEAARARDPLPLYAERVSLEPAAADELEAALAALLDIAVAEAEAQPVPALACLTGGVFDEGAR
jgi:acetoin:2,6-dichlorophenolindophenol oxidoreductase subunit alpha